MTETEKYEVCKHCPFYKKDLELIYGKASGNCDVSVYLDCDKV